MMDDDTTTRTVEAIARMESRIAELARERDAARAAAADTQRHLDLLTVACNATTLDWYRAECLVAEAMAAGLAECERLRAEVASVRAAALEVLRLCATPCPECNRPVTCLGYHSAARGWLFSCDECRHALRLVAVHDLPFAAAVRVICAGGDRG